MTTEDLDRAKIGTAYHEAAHAIVVRVLGVCGGVRFVTIEAEGHVTRYFNPLALHLD